MWLLRIFIGAIFIVSGLGKLLSPYQNFLYVIQAYQLLPSGLEVLAAQVFPWIELIVGTFVFLGLWTRPSLRAAVVLFGAFVVVVGQALLRHLSLDNCGCFGEWFHLRPQTVIVMDSVSLLLTMALLSALPQTKKFSLDFYMDRV
ncbi:MAG: DoxX family membrane protein [Candidatus Omnitrophica bacterium]|nr:DoxX family membrane protein [Candidatus Omnitrophota bacterium]MDE2221547.1 DoxX family membrane protein [Candidatus Omnitrophota bacterium]